MWRVPLLALLLVSIQSLGATIRVPQDQKTIQGAIDAAGPGDTVLVGAGKYMERVRLKPGVIVRSEGDDAAGQVGLKRAEATVIDGGGREGRGPGVTMAAGSTLDGFTVTRVGEYDEGLWKKHFDSRGEELGDDEGSVQAEGTTAAIAIEGVSCAVTRCIVHHNGDVGIGVLGKEKAVTAPLITDNIAHRNMGGGIGVAEGAEPVIRGNVCRENLRAGIGCRKANPIIVANRCYQNIRAGIGCREESRAVVRGNECYWNRRAGIGIRMKETSPLVAGNACYENEMAGIGCRDQASPVLRGNVCRNNKLAGIGVRDGAQPLIAENECRENGTAGIGIQDKSSAVVSGNTCAENGTVAISVINESEATIVGNRLSRAGGQPPIVVVKDNSSATIIANRISGDGVAGVLLQGNATIIRNSFTGPGKGKGSGVWAWEGSSGSVNDNSFDGYKNAVSTEKTSVAVNGNTAVNCGEK